ncbi:S8 family peptidase [Massilia sp. CCM 9210]|uniref:S8 family peptidase n=1 Tax=Massilia scottii TaxID=3057166 RepID=UPI002796BE14|nr:S8 family peptidase [Massilia sp. CCM 9210]MDQ1812866.1 S8 family peptidase [Massilia sp. CCM 9210]
MANRFIIGKGELLTYDIPPPPMRNNKVHPYSLIEAQAAVVPQLIKAVQDVKSLPPEACPLDIAVLKLDLHPAYIAKSFFPRAFLREAGLVSLGSRTVKLSPRTDHRITAPDICETTELFVAGTRAALARLPDYARQLQDGTTAAMQFREVENVSAMTALDRVRPNPASGGRVFEVGLHRLPDQSLDVVRRAFTGYAGACGFVVNTKYEFPVGGMLFLAVEGDPSGLDALAMFTLLRVVRPMPAVRSARPLARSSPIAVSFRMPTAQPLSDEPSVAILDGGLPDQHILQRYIGRYEKSDAAAADVPDYLEHGLGVTSAFLFGPIEPGTEAPRPYSYVDHYRVLDAHSNHEDPYELYRTLAHVEEILLSRQYQFMNLSLGPDLPYEDSDVHAWTAVLDTLLSDGDTLLTVAVGNNGERDEALQLNRIQVPSDSVNALSIGAANFSGETWARAAYSAVGPGRSPGRRKPDAVAFGGSPKEYFHVVRPGMKAELSATMGTSFASPFGLRTGVGVRAILGEDVHPLTIKALMVHACEQTGLASVQEIGWGRIPDDVAHIIMCGDGVARIIYQGLLRPGKYLRAPIPLPLDELEGKVKVSATFCYASPVDVEDAAAYTKAGLTITFRPHVDKKSGAQVKPRSFFTATQFRTEQEQRSDLGKWETVLHSKDSFYGSSLKEPTFDVHYNAREGGANGGKDSELIRYALVVTVEAPKHANLYDAILQAHARLKAIEPKITLPLRT